MRAHDARERESGTVDGSRAETMGIMAAVKSTANKKLLALALFRSRPELSTREIARRVGMPNATAARLRLRAGLAPSPSTSTASTVDAPAPLPESTWTILPTGQVVLTSTASAIQG